MIIPCPNCNSTDWHRRPGKFQECGACGVGFFVKMNMLGRYQVIPFDTVGHYQLLPYSEKQLNLLTAADIALIRGDPETHHLNDFIRCNTADQAPPTRTRRTFFEIPRYFKIDNYYYRHVYFVLDDMMFMGCLP